MRRRGLGVRVADIIGIGMSQHGRAIGEVGELARVAARAALADAGLIASEVVAVLVGNALAGDLSGQSGVRGETWLSGLGMTQALIINVENSCSSGSSAATIANHMADSMGGPVLAVGAEQMWGFDRDDVIEAIEGGFDPPSKVAATAFAAGIGTPVMALNADWSRRFLEANDNDIEAVALAACKASALAAENPHVRNDRVFTVADVLNAPIVNAPLTVRMCSRFTDGAAAAVFAPADFGVYDKRVRVRALVGISGDGTLDFHERLAIGSARLWEAAGVDPQDLSVIELHDATASEELWASEVTGVVPVGRSREAIRNRSTWPGGSGVTVNPSGGLMGRGHPIGATGLSQIFEVVSQLRDECGPRQSPGARLGATINAGGIMDRDFMSFCGFVLECQA